MAELLAEMINRVAARGGSRPAVTIAGATLTYDDVGELAERGAALLAGLGHVEGDIVMARCSNSPTMLATWLGCIRLGAVFMPVNALLTGEPLAEVMAHSMARTVIADAALVDAIIDVRDRVPTLTGIVVAGFDHVAATHRFETLLEAASPTGVPLPRPDGAAPARLMYTSGTTGRPKGVVWSRTAEAHHARCYGDELVRVDPGEAVYSCLPLFHATCQGTLLGTLWRGGHIHVDPGFEPFRFWARIRETGAVFFPYVGTILSVLSRRRPRPDDADNPVRRVMGSAAPADRWREIEDRFGLCIEDVWGQTETASCWTLPHSIPARPGTIGRPAPRFEARIVAPGEHDAEDGAGELWIRPNIPHVMFNGYFRDEAATARAFTEDGWYRSGDLVRRDGEDLVFAGRARDTIRRRGEMISPVQIEDAALRHPGVLEVAAVGVPDSDGVEEEVKLCVVADPAHAVDAAGLHALLASVLPPFMVPRYIAAYAAFPKTPTTRIQRYRLQADGTGQAWDARSRAMVTDPSAPSTEPMTAMDPPA